MPFREVKELIAGTFNEWLEGDVSKFAASLAFYTLFSLGPVLIILLAIVGALSGEDAARTEIVDRARWLIGSRSVEIISTAMDEGRVNSGTATFLGITGLLIGATAVFVNLQDALNAIWGVAPKPGWAIWPFIRKRLVSFLMILGLGLILMVSFMVSTTVATLREYVGPAVPSAGTPLAIADFMLWIAILTVSFGVIYKVLPDARVAWADVWPGAALAALLFTAGRTLIGVYLARSMVGSAFGTAGSLVVFLIWIYYSAQIFLLCSEFTQVYAKRRHAARVAPDENAVRVVKSYVKA